MPSARVSVALCTHNGAAFLDAQLASLRAQARAPDELVVCDDASTDDTRAMLRGFSGAVRFPVRIFENDRALGVTGNFARAIGLCDGDVIFTCDQDDVWHPEKLAAMAAPFERDPGLGLAFCDMDFVDRDGRPQLGTQWGALGFDPAERGGFSADPWSTLLRRNVATGAAMAFAARLRDVVLPIPESFVHDEWIALLATAVAPVHLAERPLVHYRQHGGQQIGGAVTGLWHQLAHARQHMQQAYFERQVERMRALADRLVVLRMHLRDPEAIDRVLARLGHLQRRLTLRDTWTGRLPGVLREWQSGAYQRFGYGWKSALQDLLL